MATTSSNKLLIDQLRADLDNLIAKSTQPKDGAQITEVQAAALIPVQNPGENVQFISLENAFHIMLKTMSVLNVDTNKDVGGAWVFGKKAGINGEELIGFWKVNQGTANPADDNDFEKPLGFSQ